MTKFHQTRLSGSSADPTPTSYTINEVVLTDNLDNNWDITKIVTGIEISESLYMSSIEVILDIADGIALLEQAVITGNEKIVLSVKQSQENDKRKFKLELYIAEIINFSRAIPGLNTYQFICFSKHMYVNSFSRVNRAFKGTTGQLVEKICKNDLQMERINNINTSSKNIIQGIYPRMRPLTAINWLMRTAVEDGTPFYFYETAFNGINYESYKTLSQGDVYRTYNHAPKFLKTPITAESYEEIASKVRKLSSDLNLSKLASISEGAYAGTVHTLDIHNKSYTRQAYAYDSIKFKLDEQKPFNKDVQFKDTTFDKAVESIHYYVNKNSESDNYHKPMSSIAVRQAYLTNLDMITQSLRIAGDFELTPGAIIELNIPKSVDLDRDSELTGKDKVLSGKYMVTSIMHKFEESEYVMDVECVKDSFASDWRLEG